VVGNTIYTQSTAYDAGLGRFITTLYVSDGTPTATPTTIVLPGSSSAGAVLGGKYYAFVYNGFGIEIDRIDGTTPTQVATFGSGGTTTAFAVGDRLLIFATGANGPGLYSFNGTSTHFVMPGVDLNTVSNFTVSEGKLYFIYSFNANSYLLVDDGVHPTHAILSTSGGTLSNAAALEAVPVGVMFSAFRSDIGTELFFSDGSSTSATLLGDLAPGSDHSASISIGWAGGVSGGRLPYNFDDGVHGGEPWITDGTVAGTHLLADLLPGFDGSNIANLVQFGGWTYFTAQSNPAEVPHFWATNGTTTVDLGAGTGDLSVTTAVFAGKLYFFGSGNWFEVAAPSGTPATADVTAHTGGPSNLFPGAVVLNGKLLLPGFFGVTAFDGSTFTQLSTAMTTEIVASGSVAYFGSGGDLFQTNGTVAGTISLFTDPNFPQISGISVLANGKVVFTDPFGSALWIKDGTGVHQLKDFDPSGWDNVSQPAVVGNKIYFTTTGPSGTQLWSSDGTEANTVVLDTSALGTITGSGYPFAFNGGMFIVLWGAGGGTAVRIDASSDAITVFGTGLDQVFPPVADGTGHFYYLTNTGLFVSDGTVAGTHLLAPTDAFDSGHVVDGIFYFVASTPGQGSELWRTDGTLAGTVMLTDTFTMASSNPYGFGTVSNNAPFGTSDHAALNAGASANATTRASGVLGNDADPDHAGTAGLLVTGAHFGAGSDSAVPGTGSLLLHGTYGDLLLAADGTWSYAATSTAALALAPGITATDVFSYTVGDGNGGFDTANLAMTITGVLQGLIGTPNNDTLNAGPANNGVNVDGKGGFDTLAVTGTFTPGATFLGIEAVNLTAGSNLTLTASQAMTGLAFNNAFSGSGTVTINMGGGVLLGIAGFQGAAANPGVTFVINGTVDSDYIKASHFTNTILGGAGQDQLRGGNGVDTIDGGTERDKIAGWGGADILTGGGGNDQFRYLYATDSGPGAAADRITDFTIGSDVIDLRLLDSDLVTPDIQNYALSFIGSAAFGSAGAGQIRYTTSGADMLVQFDLDGNGSSDMEIILQGLAGQTLSASDFMFPVAGAEPLAAPKDAAPAVMEPLLPASEPLLTGSFDDPLSFQDHGLIRWLPLHSNLMPLI